LFIPMFSCSTSAIPCIPFFPTAVSCMAQASDSSYSPSYDKDSSWSSLATESTLHLTDSSTTSISLTSPDQSSTTSTYTDQSIPHTSQKSIIMIGCIYYPSDGYSYHVKKS
jgi:hypothetical protein